MSAPTTAPHAGVGPTAERNGVTVAVDGTDAGLRAARWAADEAAARGGSLTFVHAAPYAAGSAGSLRAHASRILARAYTVAHRHAPDVPAHTVLLDQDPLAALVETSRQTARLGGLLVLGLAGTAHAGDALVGSLALDLVSRARGPVVVVPRTGNLGAPWSRRSVIPSRTWVCSPRRTTPRPGAGSSSRSSTRRTTPPRAPTRGTPSNGSCGPSPSPSPE